jgi:hypothetical protein
VIFDLGLSTLNLQPSTFNLQPATCNLQPPARESTEDRRTRIRAMASDTLQSLYKMQPGSQDSVENSAGYAVFDNTGDHIMMPTTVRGGGIAVASESKQETFMRVRGGRPREGTGAPDSRMIFVFESRKAFDKFLGEGWDGSNWTDTKPSLSTSDDRFSGAFRVERDMWVYQIIERGLAFQLTLAGTSYHRDDKLNKQ